MTKRKLKRSVVYSLYGCAFLLLFAGIFYLEQISNMKNMENDEDYDYVSETVLDDTVPVVNTEPTIIRPYTAEVTIVKNFYDYKADESEQQKAIVKSDKTYLQNSGVSYGAKDPFDVITILDGTVSKVTEDELLGKIVEITHSNEIISTYQSLGEVAVKENDVVTQGQIIGKSGTSNISADLGNHLYFELAVKGNIVNPENYYDKKVNEL